MSWWSSTGVSSNVLLFHRGNKLPPGFTRRDAIAWLDSAVEFWPWGYVNLEFLASFGGLSKLRVIGLVLSLRVEGRE